MPRARPPSQAAQRGAWRCPPCWWATPTTPTPAPAVLKNAVDVCVATACWWSVGNAFSNGKCGQNAFIGECPSPPAWTGLDWAGVGAAGRGGGRLQLPSSAAWRHDPRPTPLPVPAPASLLHPQARTTSFRQRPPRRAAPTGLSGCGTGPLRALPPPSCRGRWRSACSSSASGMGVSGMGVLRLHACSVAGRGRGADPPVLPTSLMQGVRDLCKCGRAWVGCRWGRRRAQQRGAA